MKTNRRNFLLASSSTLLLTTAAPPASAQERRGRVAPKPFSTEGRKVTVYTTARKTDHRIAATDEATFKPLGQPLETQVCVFVDPSKAYQTMIGIGGAITDAS